MSMRFLFRAMLISFFTATLTTAAHAHETDQFTVPDQPLADIGPELTSEIASRLQQVMDRLNEDMDKSDIRPNDPRQQPATLAKALAGQFGSNPFQTEFESWIIRQKDSFNAQPAMFSPSYGQSVFNGTALRRPLLRVAVSPTINIRGHYIGLDKIGHFVQQGHQYYETYTDVISQPGTTRTDALEAAIKRGISQENGIYGSFTIGVYSNADMAANYAGLHFYLNLTQPVSLGGRIYPPILELHQGRWRFTGNQPPADMLTRFITHHLNESMNPPCLASDIRSTFHKNVRARAERWVAFHHTTRQQEEDRLYTLTRWYGEPYGYAGPQGCVTISEAYFNAPDYAQHDHTRPASDHAASAHAVAVQPNH